MTEVHCLPAGGCSFSGGSCNALLTSIALHWSQDSVHLSTLPGSWCPSATAHHWPRTPAKVSLVHWTPGPLNLVFFTFSARLFMKRRLLIWVPKRKKIQLQFDFLSIHSPSLSFEISQTFAPLLRSQTYGVYKRVLHVLFCFSAKAGFVVCNRGGVWCWIILCCVGGLHMIGYT